MSKVKDLAELIREVNEHGQALMEISEQLRVMFTATENETPQEEPKAEKKAEKKAPAKKIELADVRAVLVEKSRAGFDEEIRSLIKECGADKLSEVDPSMYETLLAKAKEVGNG